MCAARRAACAARTPRPAPRPGPARPRPPPGPGPLGAAGKRPAALPAATPGGPRAGRALDPDPARRSGGRTRSPRPPPPPRPDPRAAPRAPRRRRVPASFFSRKSRHFGSLPLGPPSPGARDRPFRGHAGPAPAAGDRWVERPGPRCASPGRPHPRARAQAGVPGRAAWAAVPPPASPAVSARRSYPPPPEGPTSATLLAPLGRGEPFLLLVRESQALNGRGVSAS